MEQDFTVQLTGGSPWGFSLQGGVDHRSPLMVGKVTPGGRASSAGLLAGDYIIAINGQPAKSLKHLQAQQIIKNSKTSVILHCTKLRPGIMSPAVLNKPAPVFSFPVTNSIKSSPTKVRPFSAPVKKPAPPHVATSNGHARMGSLDTPSDSTCSSTVSVTSPVPATPPSATPPSATPLDATPPGDAPQVEAYNVKFMGMECCADQRGGEANPTATAPPECVATATTEATPTKIADSAATENGSAELVNPPEAFQIANDNIPEVEEVEEKVDDVTKSEQEADDVTEAEQEVDDVTKSEQEVDDMVVQDEVEDISAVVESIQKEVGEMQQEVGEMQQEVGEMQQEVGEMEQEVADAVSPAPQEVVELQQEVTVNDPPTIQEEIEPASNQSVIVKDTSPAPEPLEGRGRPRGKRNSFTKRELVDVITQAAHRRASSSGSSKDETPPPAATSAPPPSTKAPPPAPPRTVFATPITQPPQPQPQPQPTQEQMPVIKPTLNKRNEAAPLLTREPGWYQQMFQTFSNKVEEAFPGASKPKSDEITDGPTYVYDVRGLRVRSDSVSKIQDVKEIQEKREKMKSPEAPVYVYDHRGLRVPMKKGVHIRGASTPAVMDGSGVTDPQQNDNPTKLKMTPSDGLIKEDILASNRKSTAYKVQQYSTDNSRGYWKQKDKEHIEFDERRRKSQEQIFHRRHSSSSEFSTKMTSMHPLLRAEEDSTPAPAQSEEEKTSVFERIDASKLQGALTNASVLNSLEQEGVPSHLLPAIAQTQAEAKAKEQEKKKQAKPPPGPKAQASYDFQGKSEKELSFKKGDFIDLVSTVDDNWLEGSIGSQQGIFPTTYIKVLSNAEYQEIVAPKPPTPTVRALALFDYQGQTQRELSFNKGDILTIDKKVDENWYSGSYGNKEGIFPVVYVELMEEQ